MEALVVSLGNYHLGVQIEKVRSFYINVEVSCFTLTLGMVEKVYK